MRHWGGSGWSHHRSASSRLFVAGTLVASMLVMTRAAAGAASPRWIVFSAMAKGAPPAQLFRIQTDGKGLQQVTTGAQAATAPSFSPDGNRIVFVRLGAGIYVVNLDGSGLRRLTKGVRDAFPVWSPNGRQIAFLRVYKANWRVYLMTPAGRALHRLKLAPPGGRPSWSANSKSLFIPIQGGIEKVDARTGRLQRRIVARIDLGTSQAATLSPNSQRVAFVGPRPSTEGCEEPSCVVFALYMAQAPGWARRRFINDGGPAGWSPDGKTIVFVYRRGLALSPPVAGGTRTTILTGEDVPTGDSPPAWQPR